MAGDMEQLLEELRGIREHLAGLHEAAKTYLNYHGCDRIGGKRTLLEMHQKEFDKQALRWRVYQTMTPEEYEESHLKRLEKMASWTRR